MKKKIAILALDTRPCCYDFPQRIGDISQFEIIQPSKEILGEFTYFGNCKAVVSWLKHIANEVDGLIVSVDQLLYGGLVPSRIMEKTYSECHEVAQVIKEIKEENPSLLIYGANVLMRISITAKNKLYSNYWKDIFEYSQLYDQVNRLKKEEHRKKMKDLEVQIPAEILQEYLTARHRNHEINKLMISWAAEGIFDFLVITQEDASSIGIHISEQRALIKQVFELNIQDKVLVYPGADEATQTLLARMVQQMEGKLIKIFPKYLSTAGKLEVAKFEDRTIEETVTAHITAAGSLVVDHPNDADIVLIVNTPLGDIIDGNDAIFQKAHFNSRHQLIAMIQSIKYYLSKGVSVSIADISFPNASDIELVQYLLKAEVYFDLHGYAGWNTAGNSLGTCISHSIVKVLSEVDGELPPQKLEAHYAFLIERLLDEWAYQARVRGEVHRWIGEQLNVDGTNLEDQYERVNAHVNDLMQPYFIKVKAYFETYISRVGLDNKKVLALQTCQLPWNRIFEIRVKVGIE